MAYQPCGTSNFYRSPGQDSFGGLRRPMPRFYEPGELLDAIDTDTADDGTYNTDTTPHEHSMLHHSQSITPVHTPTPPHSNERRLRHSHSGTPVSTHTDATLEKLYTLLQKQEDLLKKVVNDQSEIKVNVEFVY